MGVEIDTLLRTQSGTGHLISKYVYHLTGNSTSGNLFWRNSQPGMGRGRHTHGKALLGGWECSKGMYDRSRGLRRTEERTLGQFPRGGDAGGESGKTGRRRKRRDGRTEVRHSESSVHPVM